MPTGLADGFGVEVAYALSRNTPLPVVPPFPPLEGLGTAYGNDSTAHVHWLDSLILRAFMKLEA